MKQRLLSDYFRGVAVKKLSVVETNPDKSNQHEFNGSSALRRLFGDDDRRNIPAKFIWLGGEQEGISLDGVVSWYDARRAHPARTEYRLYYPSNEIITMMKAEDTMFVVLLRDETIMVIIVTSGSIIQNQLLWLFGIEIEPDFESVGYEVGGEKIDFAVQYILDELGINLEEPETDYIDSLIDKFGINFPTTRVFSQLARDSLPEIVPAIDCADDVLLAWLEREEKLFRRLERRVVSQRLQNGFMNNGNADIDSFISFSLSVQNRRKSRAGQSLENHLEALFQARSISYSRGAVTENRNKPDFLFPHIDCYQDDCFSADFLTMLGVKLTLKERWRQVLNEAERIDIKHLITLEPAISKYQTDQIRAANLQLVIPKSIHATYRETQRKQLITVTDFLALVKQRQQYLSNNK